MGARPAAAARRGRAGRAAPADSVPTGRRHPGRRGGGGGRRALPPRPSQHRRRRGPVAHATRCPPLPARPAGRPPAARPVHSEMTAGEAVSGTPPEETGDPAAAAAAIKTAVGERGGGRGHTNAGRQRAPPLLHPAPPPPPWRPSPSFFPPLSCTRCLARARDRRAGIAVWWGGHQTAPPPAAISAGTGSSSRVAVFPNTGLIAPIGRRRAPPPSFPAREECSQPHRRMDGVTGPGEG